MILFGAALSLALALATIVRGGEVVLDGSLGASGALRGPDFDIPDRAGKTVGHNLFHSFRRFDLDADEVARFSGPDSIRNILARVTGGIASSINGTIQSTIEGANFFLLNPAGIVFGPNAVVDVSGSFVATTAHFIQLADGARFDAVQPSLHDALLTTAPPVAFGFLGPNPAPISVGGPGGSDDPPVLLAAAEEATLALIGGEIQILNRFLTLPGGRLALVGVGGPGEVFFDATDIESVPDTDSFEQMADILLDDFAFVDLSSSAGGQFFAAAQNFTIANTSFVFAETYGEGDARGVEIHARDSIQVLSGSSLTSATFGAGRGGTIHLEAGTVWIDGQRSRGTPGGSSVSVGTVAEGQSGNVVIQADRMVLRDGAGIFATVAGSGGGGKIEIHASHVTLEGTDGEYGSAGAVIGLTNFSDGPSGSVLIRAGSLALLTRGSIEAETGGSAPGGDVTIQTDRLTVANQSRLSASSLATGTGGNVAITVTQQAEVSDGAILSTSASGEGQAGRIGLTAERLVLRNGAGIQSSSEGEGAAGSIALRVGRDLRLETESVVSVASARGDGGNIGIEAGREVRLLDSRITAQAAGSGGNVTILVPVDASGNKISGPSRVYLRGSTVSAEAVQGDGGNVVVDPRFVVLDRSRILANAVFGTGGNISIVAGHFLASASLIEASSEFGLQGSVEILAPDVDLTGSVVPLSGDLLGAESHLQERCAVRLPGGFSSFLVTGPGGVPLDPEGLIPSLPWPARREER